MRAGMYHTAVVVMLACLLAMAWANLVHSELWICPQADGSVLYSDRDLGDECRPKEDLEPLQRIPSPPSLPLEGESTESLLAPSQNPTPRPRAGGGRRIDPPPDSAIIIRNIAAIPNFNSLLGVAHYQATMEVENVDGEWMAQKVCVNVRFRDINRIFLDVQQVGCLENLQPLTPKTFTVTYTGLIPPRLFPIEAEAVVDFVKWTR